MDLYKETDLLINILKQKEHKKIRKPLRTFWQKQKIEILNTSFFCDINTIDTS